MEEKTKIIVELDEEEIAFVETQKNFLNEIYAEDQRMGKLKPHTVESTIKSIMYSYKWNKENPSNADFYFGGLIGTILGIIIGGILICNVI